MSHKSSIHQLKMYYCVQNTYNLYENLVMIYITPKINLNQSYGHFFLSSSISSLYPCMHVSRSIMPTWNSNPLSSSSCNMNKRIRIFKILYDKRTSYDILVVKRKANQSSLRHNELPPSYLTLEIMEAL